VTRRSELPEHDRRAPNVPDPVRDKSVRHRHPWGSARNVREQIRITLEKLAVIPPGERDNRIVEAEDLLRQASAPISLADALLAAYYGVGRGVPS
jgi:hypothetical protein